MRSRDSRRSSKNPSKIWASRKKLRPSCQALRWSFRGSFTTGKLKILTYKVARFKNALSRVSERIRMITNFSRTPLPSTPTKPSSPPMERVENPIFTPHPLPNKFKCLKCMGGEAIFQEEAILMKHLVSMRYFVNELWNMT